LPDDYIVYYEPEIREKRPNFDFDFTKEDGKAETKWNNIIVRNFHEWLKYDLKITERQIPSILEKLEKNEAILPMYDAILVDEGQDFESERLSLISKLLNPDTQSLLLVEDRAQTIYKRKRSYLQDTGLSFQGRSKILNINYRNTAQIVNFAWDFYQSHSVLKNKVAIREFGGEIIAPQSTRRKGPEPGIFKAENFAQEMNMVVRQIQKLHEEKNVPYSEILILYRVKRTHRQNIIDTIKRSLEQGQIPYYWLTEDETAKRKFSRDDNTVKISTIESSKGLDFQAVFIVHVDNMPFPLEEDKEREVSLIIHWHDKSERILMPFLFRRVGVYGVF
jgi:superfamily I DNA/RNA helicase